MTGFSRFVAARLKGKRTLALIALCALLVSITPPIFGGPSVEHALHKAMKAAAAATKGKSPGAEGAKLSNQSPAPKLQSGERNAPPKNTSSSRAVDPESSFAHSGNLDSDAETAHKFTNISLTDYLTSGVLFDLSKPFPSNVAQRYTALDPLLLPPQSGQLRSLQLTGAGYLQLSSANSQSLNISGALTVEAWIKVASTNKMVIMGRYVPTSGAGSTNGGYELRIADSGDLRFAVYKDGTDFKEIGSPSQTIITLNQWHHVAGVYDNTGGQKRMRLYINGLLKASLTITSGFIYNTGTGTFRIGARPDASATQKFNGLIDDPRVTAAVLYNQDFALALPFPPLSTSLANIRGLWRFDNSDTTDSSGSNPTNLTRIEPVSFSTDVPQPVGGNNPPTVSITGTSPSSPFTQPATITVNATASDPELDPVSVQFRKNDVDIEPPDTIAPYSVTLNSLPAGNYTITAVARDNRGNSTVSAPFNITVSNGPPPPSGCAGAGTGTGLRGDYFDGDFSPPNSLPPIVAIPVHSRVDSTIDFNWYQLQPAPGVGTFLPSNGDYDLYGVRWRGQLLPQCTGTHYFYAFSDDGIMLWVNGQRIINSWRNQLEPHLISDAIHLTQGVPVDIVLEYYEKGGGSDIHLRWSVGAQPIPISAPRPPIVPRSQFFPAPASGSSSSLKGHWKLDEGSGTLISDSSIFNNQGSLVNGPTWITGRIGSALNFDGSNDYVQVGVRPSLFITGNQLTMAAWIKPNGGGGYRAIMNREGEYEVGLVGGQLAWAISNTTPAWNWVLTGYFPPVNTWTHVAVVYDGLSVKTYINGQINSPAHSSPASGPIIDSDTASNEFRIGSRQCAPCVEYFGGGIDDVRVYDRALSLSEIQQLGNPGGNPPPPTVRVPYNYDGDSKTDIAVWRPSTSNWHIINSSGIPTTQRQWGQNADIPVAADYDGDGKTDLAVYRPSNSTWHILNSSGIPNTIQQWGESADIPVPGDYTGDGKADIAVWRPSNGNWYIITSLSPFNFIVRQYGESTDVPVPGNFDGDQKTDIAIWRPSTGNWHILNSSGIPESVHQWGLSADIPTLGDYDGDGKTDLGIYRPGTGTWWVRHSSGIQDTVRQWGESADIPVPGDYTGDGKADIAVWRPSNGNWYIITNLGTGESTVLQWGVNGDVPVSAFLTRRQSGGPPPNQAPTARHGGPYNGTVGTAIQFNGSASSDPDGTITNYHWNFGDNTTGSGPTPIHVYSGAITYTATLTVTDDDGATNSASTNVVITNAAPGRSPFNGPHNVPGLLQAEDFDNGGPGVAYSDITPGNDWGAYRSEGVDIGVTGDAGGGYEVANAWAGEWMEYTINVTAAGNYDFQARIASGGPGGTFHFEVDRVPKGSLTVPDTGGWGTYQTITLPNINLTAGQHILRVSLDTNGAQQFPAIANFNYFNFVASGSQQGGAQLKEYIYVSGRLVATEESTVSSSSPASASLSGGERIVVSATASTAALALIMAMWLG
jgi:Concanavalin A-like lectin/glucanases superfamily/PKD domain/Carbohydrate binding module (family 6)/PA14 domain/Bacterial Ig domain